MKPCGRHEQIFTLLLLLMFVGCTTYYGNGGITIPASVTTHARYGVQLRFPVCPYEELLQKIPPSTAGLEPMFSLELYERASCISLGNLSLSSFGAFCSLLCFLNRLMSSGSRISPWTT